MSLDARSSDSGGVAGAARFQALARVIADGGAVSSSGGTVTVSNANSATVLISIGTNRVSYNNVSGEPAAVARRHLDAAQGPVFR